MADHLAQRFGTEKDRVNCPFYIKIGYVTTLMVFFVQLGGASLLYAK
jgi:hypothetical protein